MPRLPGPRAEERVPGLLLKGVGEPSGGMPAAAADGAFRHAARR
jgi:hypothetical protein